MDGNMVAVLEVQNKNLASQIDTKKTQLTELLAILEGGGGTSNSVFPDLWPTVKNSVISSNYGGRIDPVAGGGDWHTGRDIAADFGEPVFASAMGTVEVAGWNGGYGRYVEIGHSTGYGTEYGHMSASSVEPGQVVR